MPVVNVLENGCQHCTLAELEEGLETLLAEMIGDDGRWIVVIERGQEPLRYVQLLAFEGSGSAVVAEAVSDAYLDSGSELSRYEAGSLRQLGWSLADAEEDNWRIEEETPSASVHDLACRLVATLRWAFGCDPQDQCLIKLWESDIRSPGTDP